MTSRRWSILGFTAAVLGLIATIVVLAVAVVLAYEAMS